jgi:hypothetical protein
MSPQVHERWARGDVVALRDIWFDAVWRAIPGLTLEDTSARSVFWIPPGTQAAYPADADGEEIRMPRPEFEHAFRYSKRPIVVVCDDGAPWTVWLFFGAEGFEHWYVNFERYLGRSATAYDSVDHKLDLIVGRDGEVRWKDEDELAAAGELGLVDVEEVRRDAEAAIATPPWPTGWEDFEAEPGWKALTLPAGWERRR